MMKTSPEAASSTSSTVRAGDVIVVELPEPQPVAAGRDAGVRRDVVELVVGRVDVRERADGADADFPVAPGMAADELDIRKTFRDNRC